MRQSDTSRILSLLSDGRWHASEEMADTICIDYRSRISELKRRGYPIVGRKMTRTRPDGSHRYSNDWRDDGATERLKADVAFQVAAARNDVPDNRTRATIVTPAGSVTVMGGRLRLLTVDAMTDEIMRGLGID
jgi:hypothetical protein